MGAPIVIPIMVLIGWVITAAVISTSIVQAIYAIRNHCLDGQLDPKDIKEIQSLQKKLDEYLRSLFDIVPIGKDDSLPLPNIVIPSEEGSGYLIPRKIGGLKGGAGGAPNGFFRYIIEPAITIKDENGNIIFQRPPGYTDLPIDPIFKSIFDAMDITPFCGPIWKPWMGPHPPPGDGSGPAAGFPICAAAGHLYDTPGVVYNRGFAGGVTVRDFTSQGIFHIRKFQRSGTLTILNETDDILVLGDPFANMDSKMQGIYASHGFPVATSSYCFPGQKIQIAGLSSGAGIEVYFRFQIWSVPRKPSVHPKIKEMLDAAECSLDAYMFETGDAATQSKLVANMYVFLDVPWSGSNKIKVHLEDATKVFQFPQDTKQVADYGSYQDIDHTAEGGAYTSAYRFPKGENGVGQLTLRKKS